ncbi:MAG: diheme cytochrome c-553 [Opitutaceae bacterium]|nr:diheme cytochrome c-553 [Verrucomicrobiales bacterium]
MKNITRIALAALVIIPATFLLTAGKPEETQPKNNTAGRVERGKYLVNYGGCHDCHTPLKFGPQGPQPDMSRMLSGHPEDAKLPPPDLKPGPWFAATAGMTAWAGPWGISYAANLTPDKNTGLGIWTEAMFVTALRTGKHMGVGREILPPMPWQNAGQLTDEDLKSVFAYLRTVPAIANHVPTPLGPDGKSLGE